MSDNKRPKRSEIWNYFEALDAEYATCNMCLHKLSYKTSTSNLKKHLNTKHPAMALNLSKFSTPKALPSSSSLSESCVLQLESPITVTSEGMSCDMSQLIVFESRPEVSAVVSRQETFQESSKQEALTPFLRQKMPQKIKQEIDQKLLQLFITDFQPFNLVNDKGFKEFVRALNPTYELPSQHCISKTLIPSLFETCKNRAKEAVKLAKTFCITTDCWSSVSVENYMAVTAHYITNTFELKSVLLECVLLEDHHTSKNLSEVLDRVVKEWELENKILLTISDNEADIKEAIKNELGWKHFGCFAHTLNSIVKGSLKETSIDNLLSKVRNVIAQFKSSSVANEKLISFQKNLDDQPQKLINDVQMRWISTFFMLERFSKLEEAVRSTTALINKDIPTFSSEEWKIINELCLVLKPFADVTQAISGDTHCTAALIVPLYNGLKNVCANLRKKDFSVPVANCLERLEKELNETFAMLETNKMLSVCTFIDPRFKHLPFSNINAAEQAKNAVSSLVSSKLSESQVYGQLDTDDQVVVYQSQVSDELNVWSQFDQVAASVKPKGTLLSKALIEVQRYCDADILPRNEDPLRWWGKNKYVFPILSEVAQERLCILGTSVPCKRLFSKAGLVLNERRTRLSDRNVKILLFLNVNWGYLNE